MAQKKVTTVRQLEEYAKGQIMELPPFAEGQPFVARVRRPSLMVLAKSGKIPNSLLTVANKLFLEGKADEKDEKFMPKILDVFRVICEACLLEPSMKDMDEAGIELTDEQMMFLFSYTQEGVKALERFRSQFDDSVGSGSEQKVQHKAE